MNLPPGFELEDNIQLPEGFELEGQSQAKAERTTIGEDLAQGFAGVGNTADTLGTLAYGGAKSLLGMNRGGGKLDSLFQGLEERKKARLDWAGGQGKEKGLSGHVLSAIGGLPGLPLAPVSGLERTTDLLDQGVPLKQAAVAGGVDSALSTGAAFLPIVGKTIGTKAATGAVANMVTGGISDAATQGIVQDKKVAAQYNPLDPNRRLTEGILGAAGGAMTGRVKDAGTGLKSLDEIDTPPPVDTARADVVAAMDQQLRQQYVNQDLDSALQRPPMTLEDTRVRPPVAQEALPFSTGVEEIAARQADPQQPDLFMDQPSAAPKPEVVNPLTDFGTGERTGYSQGQELFPELPKDLIVPERPSIETAVEKLANNQQFDMTATEKVAWDKAKGLVEEFDDGSRTLSDRQIANKILDRQWVEEAITKAKQVDQMYAEVEAKAASIAEKKAIRERRDAMEEKLVQLQEHLEASAYKPDLGGQGPKTRAAQAEQNPGYRTGTKAPWNQGRVVPRSQLGAIILNDATKPKEGDKLRTLSIQSPEVVAEKERLARDKQRAIAAKTVGLDSYDSKINSPEGVLAALEGVKDIGFVRKQAGGSISAGINNVAINSNHPLVKFTREQIHKLQHEVDQLSREHITDKKTGLQSVLGKMSQQEKNAAHALLMKGDKDGKFMTRADMERVGATENTIKFVEKIYAIDKIKLDIWNKARAEVGLPEVVQRSGHYPGVFKGDYKSLVYKINDKGEKVVVGVIATDTFAGNKLAQRKILKDMPGVTFKEMDRRKLGGNGNRSDMFSGVGDLIELLGHNNPEIAKVQEIVRSAIREQADALYGASLHSLDKKGVFGSQGNKSWRSENQNANDAIKAYVNYWEEGIISHLNLPTEAKLKALMENPALDNHKNAKNYVNEYIRNYTGRNLGTTGDVLNGVVDMPFRLLGLGPSIPRGMINQFNKRAGQLAMAYGNLAFTAIQFAQVGQMAYPEMMRVARLAGGSQIADPMVAMGSVLKNTIELFKESRGVKTDLDPVMKQAVAEAKRRGINQFSEFKDVNAVTQNKYSRKFDEVVDYNRSVPEAVTRSFVFYSFVKMLEKSVPKDRLYDVAYNATQTAMIDYSLAERPMMYQKLGTAGQLAGSLQTFKHGYMSQQGRLYKDAAKGIATGKFQDALPAAMSGVIALSLAGIMGIPFYQEIDELVKKITSMYGEQKNIEQTVLPNMDEWQKRGLLSAESGINFQSRLSAANMLPDGIVESLTPYAGMASNMAGAIGNVIKHDGNPESLKHLAYTFAPNGPIKKWAERNLKRDENGTTTDAQGRKNDPRPEMGAMEKVMGFTPLQQALDSEKDHVQMQRDIRKQDKLKSITEKAKYATRTGQMNQAKFDELMADYRKFNGDPETLIESIVMEHQQSKLTKQQRLQGIPSDTKSSLDRWKNYNEY